MFLRLRILKGVPTSWVEPGEGGAIRRERLCSSTTMALIPTERGMLVLNDSSSRSRPERSAAERRRQPPAELLRLRERRRPRPDRFQSPRSTIVTVLSGCRSNHVWVACHIASGESGGTWVADVWIRTRPGPVGGGWSSKHRKESESKASPPIQSCGSAPGASPSPRYPGDATVTGLTVGRGSDPMSQAEPAIVN